MRAILLVLILAVVALIAAFATGLLDIDQTRPAQAPSIDAGNASARGGQAPTFDIETGSVSVGATERNVTVPVPTVEISRPDEQAPADNRTEQQPQGR